MRKAHRHHGAINEVEPEERTNGAQPDEAHDGVGDDLHR